MSHAQKKQSVILGALEQSNLFGPSNKVLYLKKLVIKSGVCFLILFVLVDAILQKVVYLKNKSGTGVVFLALCMYLMVMIDNSSLFCLYIFVLEDLAFFPTVVCHYEFDDSVERQNLSIYSVCIELCTLKYRAPIYI